MAPATPPHQLHPAARPTPRAVLLCAIAAHLMLGWAAAEVPTPPEATLGEPPLAPPLGSSNRRQPGLRASMQLAAAPTFASIATRASAKTLWRQQYNVSAPVQPSWTGSAIGCKVGNTTAAWQQSVRTRVNYFRAAAGLQPVTFTATLAAEAQRAALTQFAQGSLSHYPDKTWKCYTSAAYNASGRSNLAFGPYLGRAAIDAYMNDFNVATVGHRFWLLCPYVRTMGTGDAARLWNPWVPSGLPNGCCKQPTSVGAPGCTSTAPCPAESYWMGVNVLRVVPTNNADWAVRPATRQTYVAWPPPGFVPWNQVYDQWTLSYPLADFSTATVSLTMAGKAVPLASVAPGSPYGDDTLIWTLKGDFTASGGVFMKSAPAKDTPIKVIIKNVFVLGQPKALTLQYSVTLFDPTK